MAESHDPHAPAPAGEESVERGHELSDVSLRGIAIAGIVLVLSAVVIQVICWVVMVSLQRPTNPDTRTAYNANTPPPAPQLQGNPRHTNLDRRDMTEMRRREGERLGSYAWVDPGHTIAQIPIDRAMQIALNGHLPAHTPGTMPATQPAVKSLSAAHASALPPSQEQP